MNTQEQMKKQVQEQLESERAYSTPQYSTTQSAGIGGCGSYKPPTLRERFEKRLVHTQQQMEKAEELRELLSLLDKYPDVLRILELVEKLGLH